MDFSMTDTFQLASTRGRHRLFLFCVILSFLGYMLYSHFANQSVARVNPARQRLALDGQHMSRGLLHENYDWDATDDDWDEAMTAVPEEEEEPPDRSRGALSRKLPQAIIIGVKKGGTRALLEYLRLHQDIVCAKAEPHFFNRNYQRGLEWYRRLMPLSAENQMTIEKTPAYFVTKEVPARILAMSQSVKLIVVIREPVTRAISDYTQALEKKPNISSFESLAFRDKSRGVVETEWGAIQIGLYYLHLMNWIKYFPLSQMLFVNGDRLITHPAEEVGRVQEFLGVKKLITEKNFHYDEEKGFFCLKKAEENYEIPHCLGKSKGRSHPEVRAQAIQNLKTFFKPYNKMLFNTIGEDFGWDTE